MEFSELIASRYSVRAYQSRPVEEDVLQAVLEAFLLAPTAANRQPLGLILIKTAGRDEALKRIYPAEWFSKQPPYVVCMCTTPDKAWTRKDGKNYADVDAAIAMDHLVLAATDQGLGTCWIGAFDRQAAIEELSLPEGVEPILLSPLGYPADTPRPKLRKKAADLVHYDRW